MQDEEEIDSAEKLNKLEKRHEEARNKALANLKKICIDSW